MRLRAYATCPSALHRSVGPTEHNPPGVTHESATDHDDRDQHASQGPVLDGLGKAGEAWPLALGEAVEAGRGRVDCSGPNLSLSLSLVLKASHVRIVSSTILGVVESDQRSS